MSENNKVIAVVGPTASGKTALGVALSLALSGEVVSADSMQIYNNMPIASAMPTAEEMCGVPHHLIGFAPPTHKFSVAEYVKLAEKSVADILCRKKLPVIVGGTGLYIDSLINGIRFEDEDCSAVRSQLEAEADLKGIEPLFERLNKADPVTAARLHLNDRKRIIRALEVLEIHGKTATEMNAVSKQNGPRYSAVWLGITYKEREKLYDRINRRVDTMLENGLLKEAETAYATSGGTAVQAIGHKEFFPYFEGKLSLDEAVDTLKTETRRYAKRQLTWFRRNSQINWIYADEADDVFASAMEIIKNQQM